MRLLYLVFGLLAITTASTHFAGIVGAVKGVTALGDAVSRLVTTILPAGLLLPFAALGPLKLSLPMLLALKGMGFLKFKLLLTKVPLLSPVNIASAKFGLLRAKYGLGRTALSTVGKAKMGLIQLPVKLTAFKLGALAGTTAGAKAGLAAYKARPKMGILKATLLPTTTLFSESRNLLNNISIPMKKITVQIQRDHKRSHAEPEAESGSEEPLYDQRHTMAPRPAPAYTPLPFPYTLAPPAYTPSAPAYVPAPLPGPIYRKRRSAYTVDDQLTVEALSSIFTYIQTYDSDRCVHRLVCELAVQPELAGTKFADVTQFMTSLPSDPAAPWMSYKNASATGSTSRNRTACRQHYNKCGRPTELLIETARRRLAGVDF